MCQFKELYQAGDEIYSSFFRVVKFLKKNNHTLLYPQYFKQEIWNWMPIFFGGEGRSAPHI